MSPLIASYDGILEFNKPPLSSCSMYKSLHVDWLKITNAYVARGDMYQAKQAFEVSAAYARLTMQNVWAQK